MAWFLLIISLVTQELATTGAALLNAQANHLNPWLIHLTWFTATLIDIAIGYFVGIWVQQKFARSKVDAWAKKWAARVDHVIGKTGLKAALALLSFISYPYITAFVASWLPDISLTDIFIYTTIGNFFWYLFEWATVLGITAAGHDYQLIFIIVAIAGIAFIAIANFIKKVVQ